MIQKSFGTRKWFERCSWLRAGIGIGAVIFTANLISSADTVPPPRPSSHDAGPQNDQRPGKLKAFFAAYRCPGPQHIDDYLRAADAYRIDYRLLPALSVRESTCGQHARLNNRWGWDSARTGFESVARGIEFIARQLAWGRSYRGKTIEQKLHTYNPNPQYAGEIKRLMREIDAD